MVREVGTILDNNILKAVNAHAGEGVVLILDTTDKYLEYTTQYLLYMGIVCPNQSRQLTKRILTCLFYLYHQLILLVHVRQVLLKQVLDLIEQVFYHRSENYSP